jgi:hypothetical protein
MLSPLHFYNPTSFDHVAVISVQPAGSGTFHIQVARGAKAHLLNDVSTTGPFAESELPDRLAEVEQSLRASGYLPAGVHALLAELQSAKSKDRALAAGQLGWMRSTDAVQPLLDRLPSAVDDVCSIIDALGMIGDSRAVPALRQQGARKLLSRRRSAVEALRLLNDPEGLAEARKLALDRLPETVRKSLLETGESASDTPAVEKLVTSVISLEPQQQGLAIDTLYEIAAPLAVAAVRAVLRQVAIDKPHLWRYAKSVLRRAMLRHDHATLGELIHRIEILGRTSKGTSATVKSGYDGVQRETRIFSPNTVKYVRRMVWRYLRNLAGYRPEMYPRAAAEMVANYRPEDAEQPRGLFGSLAGCYLLNRIMWTGGKRLFLDDRKLRFRYRSSQTVNPPTDVREEAYPHLWDAQPAAFVRVLGGCMIREVQAAALASFFQTGKHAEAMASAPLPQVIALLNSPMVPTVTLGLEELERRFDPGNPDWTLLQALIADDRPAPRELGQRFLHRATSIWTRDPDRIIQFLAIPHGDIRPVVVELARDALRANPALRQILAPRILAILRQPEPAEGAHDGYAQLACSALLQELNTLLSVAELVELVFKGSPAGQSVAGELLQRRPEAMAELRLERLVALAQHPVLTVRQAAHGLLRSALDLLRNDPAALFVLVESDWADTRNLAFELVRQIDLAVLGLDGLLGLLDSNRVDVQDLGKELVRKNLDHLHADEMVFRLAQHPHPNMRHFVLDLVEKHLPGGAGSLAQLGRFFRAAIFDSWPQRAVKHRVIDVLQRRGLQDASQAAVAAGILGDAVHLHGRADSERALEALVRIKLAYPEVEAGVTLWPGGEK